MRRGRRAEDERGNILILSALLIVPLLIFVGLSVDVGSWHARASRLQRAADAAALAGVVWMPDFDKAEEVALATARRNGFVTGTDDITVTVSRDPSSNRRLRVNIEDGRVETFFGRVVTDSIRIGRRAIAEYVLPVPLGSPTNYFGTGDLLGLMGQDSEYFWAAVNGYCTDKVDGDRVLSRYFGNKSPYGCPGGTDNTEYRADGYTYYVELPPNRTAPVTLAVYDAGYYPGAPGGSPDLSLRNPSTIDTIFELRAADGTPLDDSDNPLYTGCGGSGESNPRTFGTDPASTVFNYPFLGPASRQRWTRYCTIPTTAPAGRYLLEVRTAAGQANSTGSNGYSLLARLGTGTFCDSRTDASCPRIYGKDDISVFARTTASVGSFYLSEIDRIHAGKSMVIRLWDPGEGGDSIRIRNPDNELVEFTYSVDGAAFTTVPTTSLDVTASQFNGKSIELLVSLVGYDPPANNNWWKIEYRFRSGVDVTDRTTWSVSLIGDPVHLVEER